MRDADLQYDSAKALTSSAVSANTVQLGTIKSGNAGVDLGKGGQTKLALELRVGTAFTSSGSSTLVVALQTDADSAFGSVSTPFQTPSIPKASLTAGAKLRYPLPAGAYEQHSRLSYTVGTADFTGGTISAEIVMDYQSYTAPADNQPAGGY